MNGLRDILVILGCTLFLGALMSSVAGIARVTGGDATTPVVAAGLAGFGLGLALTSLFPGSQGER